MLKNWNAQNAQAGSLNTYYHKKKAGRFVKQKIPVPAKRHCFQMVESLLCRDENSVNEHIQAGALDKDKEKPLLAPPGVFNTAIF